MSKNETAPSAIQKSNGGYYYRQKEYHHEDQHEREDLKNDDMHEFRTDADIDIEDLSVFGRDALDSFLRPQAAGVDPIRRILKIKHSQISMKILHISNLIRTGLIYDNTINTKNRVIMNQSYNGQK